MIQKILNKKSSTPLLAIFCAIAWAMAFPLIKIGFRSFAIAENDTASKTLFAGVRFFCAGLVIMIIAKLIGKSFKLGSAHNKLIILLFGLVNTALHYFFFYMGLSHLTGSRSAIIDSLGSFLLIILSCIFFADDRLSANKIVGCILGISGILMININAGSELFSGISLLGDGMLICSAVSSAIGGLLTRAAAKKTDPAVATGISLTFGGFLLIIAGVIGGGRITQVNLSGTVALVLLIAISAAGFGIYNYLLCRNPVSKIAIFNALIPILGVMFSCIILGEEFSAKYIIAGLIVAIGIYFVNKSENRNTI